MISLELFVMQDFIAPVVGPRWGWKIVVQETEILRSEALFPDPMQAWSDGDPVLRQMLAGLLEGVPWGGR